MTGTINLSISSTLADALANSSLLSQLDDGQLQLLISSGDNRIATELVGLLKQCAAGAKLEVATVDYSAYFSAVVGSALYKPANPHLAISQVAKSYQLDVQSLAKAFKAGG